MASATQDLTIYKGKTFSRVLRWESEPFIYKPITGITQAAPAVVTATGHGVPDGWRVAIVSVPSTSMREINAKNVPPRSTDYTKAKLLSANTLELNAVNSSEFHAWIAGGYVQYYTPVDLTGYTARMQIRATKEATAILLSLTTGAPDTRIVLDNTAKTITLTVSATDTAALTFKTGVYDLEMISAGGVVTKLLEGNITVEEEVTR